MLMPRARLFLALALIAVFSACGDTPAEPEPPRTLEGVFEAVHAVGQPLPFRFDTLIPPPQSGEWWHKYLEAATLTLRHDGTYRIDQVVWDSFPNRDVRRSLYDSMYAAGTYEVRDDTLLVFTPEEMRTITGLHLENGGIWGEDTVWTYMLGTVFERVQD